MVDSILLLLLVAFCGGLIGSSMSGMITFGTTCLIGLIGTISGNYSIVDNITFGPILIPCVVFSAGVASIAFAANKKGLAESGQMIMTPMVKYDTYLPILVGGCFGVVAYGFLLIFQNLGIKGDLASYVVVIMNIIARYLFGNTGLINKEVFQKNFFVRDEVLKNLLIGLGFSTLSVYVTFVTGETFFSFFISGLAFIFLALGFNAPVSHHITLPTAYAFVATNQVWIALLTGIICALVGPIFEKLVNKYKDTHVDYPSITIGLASLVIFYFM